MSVHHAKNIFSSSLQLNVVSLPSRPSNFVMRWKYWDSLDIHLSRKRRRSFGHKFMLDNRYEIISYIIEIGRNLIECVKSLLARWNVFYLDVRRHWFTVRETVCEDQREYCSIHTHRNLGIPNRAIQSKFLPRHVGVTKHIRIGVTGPYPTTWHRKVEFFFLTVVLNRQRTQSIFFCMSNTTYPSSSRRVFVNPINVVDAKSSLIKHRVYDMLSKGPPTEPT